MSIMSGSFDDVIRQVISAGRPVKKTTSRKQPRAKVGEMPPEGGGNEGMQPSATAGPHNMNPRAKFAPKTGGRNVARMR